MKPDNFLSLSFVELVGLQSKTTMIFFLCLLGCQAFQVPSVPPSLQV